MTDLTHSSRVGPAAGRDEGGLPAARAGPRRYAILSALADRLGFGPEFTEGRTARDWLEHLYLRTRKALADRGDPAPGVRRVLGGRRAGAATRPGRRGALARFRADPDTHRLPTRLERHFDPAAVRELNAAAVRGLTVGGANLAAQALRAGLVDECRLFVWPLVVGGGPPALPTGARADLELLDERRFGNGVVLLRYRPVADAASHARTSSESAPRRGGERR